VSVHQFPMQEFQALYHLFLGFVMLKITARLIVMVA
jgi:hypothetical protein